MNEKVIKSTVFEANVEFKKRQYNKKKPNKVNENSLVNKQIEEHKDILPYKRRTK